MAKKSTIISVTEFSSDLKDIPKPGKRAKARIYCNTCNRHHHLHWSEFKNALNIEKIVKSRPHHPGRGHKNPESLQDIIDIYAFKYCVNRTGEGYEYEWTIQD